MDLYKEKLYSSWTGQGEDMYKYIIGQNITCLEAKKIKPYLECFQWANILGQKNKNQLNGKTAFPQIVTGYRILMEEDPKEWIPD